MKSGGPDPVKSATETQRADNSCTNRAFGPFVPPWVDLAFELGKGARLVNERWPKEGVATEMTLTKMFADQEARTFEERRAEVVAIVRSAADFAGADYGLRSLFRAMCDADNENEFDEAYDKLASSLSENTLHFLHSA